MTINKIAMSALAASAIVTAATAGTVSLGSGTANAAMKVSNIVVTDSTNTLGKDVNVTSSKVITYTPSQFTTGQQESAAVTMELSNGNWALSSAAANASTGIKLVLSDNNATVARYKNHTAGTIIFDPVTNDGVTALVNGKTYILTLDDNGTDLSSDLAVKLKKTEAAAVALTVSSGSSATQTFYDTAAADFMEMATEFSAAVTTSFDAQIDAAASFKSFYSASNDTAEITLTKNAVDVSAGNAAVEVVFGYDTNLTGVMSESNSTAYTTLAMNDKNTTGTIAAASLSTGATYDLTFTPVNGMDDKILETTFTASLGLDFTNLTDDLTLLDGESAGSWDIYGYKAQIPNAAGLSTHDTVLKFTNRSTIEAHVYITLIDPAGETASIDSVNDGIAKIVENATGTYKVSDLVAIAATKNAQFDGTGSVSVEVVIPTTPSQVYGMASFKNNALGQFKDLPVYNNSGLNY